MLATNTKGFDAEHYRFKGNEPLLLDDPQAVWILQSGSMSLFAITVENANLEGRRRHLFNIQSGEAMFSTAPEPRKKQCQLLAVSLEETELLRLSRNSFELLLASQRSYRMNLVECWINHLGSVFTYDDDGNIRYPEPTLQFLSLADGEVFRPHTNAVSWVSIQKGNAKLMGFSELMQEAASGMLPLSGNMWLQAENTVELEVHNQEIEQSDALMIALLQMQMDFLKAIHLFQRLENRKEILRFQERKRLNHQVMEETLDELSNVIQTTEIPINSPLKVENSSYEELLVAVGAVARALGVTIKPPAKSEDLKRVKQPLEAIARASRIRLRQLHLASDWWKNDLGPMLGYIFDDERPVALLPVSGGYEIFDSVEQIRIRVNERIAANVSSTAYMFYRPLPDKDLKTWDLLKFALHGHIQDLIIIILTGIAVSLLGMVTPQATAILMDNAIPDANQSLLMQIALGLTASAFGATIFQIAQGFAILRLETFADSSTQSAVWDRLLNLKVSFFRQYSIGDLESRVSAISEIRAKLSATVLTSIFSGVFAFLNLGLLISYSGSLALIAIGAAIVNIAVTVFSGLLTLRKVRPMMELQGQLFGVMVQLINGVGKLRVAGAEERAFAYWGKQYSQQLKLILGTQNIEDMVRVVNEILPTLTSCLLFAFTASSLQQGQQAVSGHALSIGTFLAFNSAFGTFIGGATSLSNTIIDVLEVVPLWKRAQPILEAKPEVSINNVDPGKLSGRISVENLIFRYRQDGSPTLDNVNLRAEPGEFIALVGTSGSGKSTLFRLLLGFDTPESGGVFYDGKDLSGLDINAVRRQFGVVLQNSRLMSASIFENIASGANITTDEAWQAAEMAGFEADIQAMPMGMHTIVSEGGGNISGGQRQRLLITRALVLKPKILLFDEATSALDNKTQAIVSESLDKLKVTRIVIAHRLSTIRNADRIYVLQSGKVVQHGSFDQLAKQQGLFAQLIERQKL